MTSTAPTVHSIRQEPAWYVEYLTPRSWVCVLYYLLKHCRSRHTRPAIYYIDASRCGFIIARITYRLFSKSGVRRLNFYREEVVDADQLSCCLRIWYKDLAEVLSQITSEAIFTDVRTRWGLGGRLLTYIKKSVATDELCDRGSLWHVLFLIQVCAWYTREKLGDQRETVLFLVRRPWFNHFVQYGKLAGVRIFETRSFPRLSVMTKQWLGAYGAMLLRYFRNVWYNLKLQKKVFPDTSYPTNPSLAQIGVEYHGQFNLSQPERHSDLFFWQQSSLSGSNISLLFTFKEDPIDSVKLAELRRHEMGAIALYPGSSTVSSVPVSAFRPSVRGLLRTVYQRPFLGTLEKRWVSRFVEEYDGLREYWSQVFMRHNVRLFLTWYRYDARHIAMTDAIHAIGGIMAIYQRAFQIDASPELHVDTDLMFGYSSLDAEVERRSGSHISYHVAVGYLGDHRFSLLKEGAQQRHAALRARGAQYIVAYFDENSVDEARWHTGHEFLRENYRFLLEKVLACPWFGLVLKPKSPSSLRHRLGPIDDLLSKAISTGRCFMYEGGLLHGAYPPAAAALASDLAIHGHLCTGSAGFESALAGTPTLLLDREGWSVSQLYRLREGRVAFRNWQDIWSAIQEHRSREGGIPGFGDWSEMLDTLDPFRDGRAAERVGVYLQWILEGFKAGGSRQEVLASVAERYRRAWGEDKVVSVNQQV